MKMQKCKKNYIKKKGFSSYIRIDLTWLCKLCTKAIRCPSLNLFVIANSKTDQADNLRKDSN